MDNNDSEGYDDDYVVDDIENEIEYEDNHEKDNINDEVKEDIKESKVLINDSNALKISKLRPQVKSINSESEDFQFMQIDIDSDIYTKDYYVSNDLLDKPIIRMYGVTETGNSVCAIIEGFYPYFYVRLPQNVNEKNLDDIKKIINSKIESKKHISEGVKHLEIIKKIDFKNYHPEKESFLKITLSSQKLVTPLREFFESNEIFEWRRFGYSFDGKTYESKLSFPLRYMIDNGIVGVSWITFPKEKYIVKNQKYQISTCQIEITINYKDVISHKPEGEYAKIAPIRILSFDIEAASESGSFPNAKKDPVIQISNYLVEFGKNNNKPISNTLFSYKSCSHIPGADVICFDKEDELLRNWQHFIVLCDPDIIIGYNINNFDLPYLFDRAEHIGVKSFGRISRIKSTNTKARRVGTSSAKAFNNRELISINMDGRNIIDMYLLIVKDHKLRSNTLNNVSFHFLGEQKEDVHHSMIYDLWKKDETTRKRLGIYCIKDSILTWKLCEKLMTIYNYAEMCRVTCTPLSFILLRGQQIKVLSQIHVKAKDQDYIIPNERITNSNNSDEVGFEGATVLDPLLSFYKEPIVTLDFASLYPSIMIAHNLCYSTLIKSSDICKYKSSDYTTTPLGHVFMKPHIRKGILPIILEDLINARKKAKKDLKEANDPSTKAVLDGRQLALKISANSVYGFTGAQVGQLPCLEISSSVTSFGRVMIEKTRDFVERQFKIVNGYSNDAVVIYGDTDSVMVKFGITSLEEAMKLGKEASEMITKEFINPIKIEFEKVYFPYLLMKKKRYAGLIWTNTSNYDKIDMKGLESVRRDNCELVKDTLDKLISFLLLDEDGVNKALDYAKATISDVMSGKVDMSKLIITKSISKKIEDSTSVPNSQSVQGTGSNKNKTYTSKQAHTELAEKMKKRDEGSAPNIGDRVPYVMIVGAKGTKNYQNSEDPKYVIEKELPIDYKYYVENQLKKPIIRLFDLVIKNSEQKIFSGSHMIQKQQTISTSNIFSKFLTKKNLCLNCKTGVDKEAICKGCKKKEDEIYMEKFLEYSYFERMYYDLWSHCSRCQGLYGEPVICENYDCSIYYKRLKIRKELVKQNEKIERFKLEI